MVFIVEAFNVFIDSYTFIIIVYQKHRASSHPNPQIYERLMNDESSKYELEELRNDLHEMQLELNSQLKARQDAERKMNSINDLRHAQSRQIVEKKARFDNERRVNDVYKQEVFYVCHSR